MRLWDDIIATKTDGDGGKTRRKRKSKLLDEIDARLKQEQKDAKEPKRISLQELIGKGYGDFWRCKTRYRVVKGSRASKKSTTTALNIISRIIQYPLANVLVVRKTAATLKDSCWTQLRWAIDKLGVGAHFKCRVSPLEIEYTPTGQRILFRGMDDGFKITSITVKTGVLCWGWVEEAYEIEESEFQILDESLRGVLPDGYFVQWTLTFNPWSASSWLKSRFFDISSDNVFTLSTTYKVNEWLSEDDRAMFEEMRVNDPTRYKTAGLAEWGIADGQYFDAWRDDVHVVKPFKIPDGWVRLRAMDWGSFHPYACLWFAVDYDGNMWCYREIYGWGGKPNVGTKETAKEVAEKIAKAEKRGEVRYGVLDNACWANTGVTGPTIAEEINTVLYKHHLITFGKSSKGREMGANALRERLIGRRGADDKMVPGIYFFSDCIHTIRTIPMLAHDKNRPETYDTNGEDHAVDAVVYACLSRPYSPHKPQRKPRRDKYAQETVHGSVWTA